MKINEVYAQVIDDLHKMDAPHAIEALDAIRKKTAAQKYDHVGHFCQDVWQMAAEKDLVDVVESVVSVAMPWLRPFPRSVSNPHDPQQQNQATVGIKVMEVDFFDGFID